jgi:hypothetical protein
MTPSGHEGDGSALDVLDFGIRINLYKIAIRPPKVCTSQRLSKYNIDISYLRTSLSSLNIITFDSP